MNFWKQLRSADAKWRALVCLFLVLSFLYNPYLTAQVSGGGLKVCHPFSHRATVGSSELERYSPLGNQDIRPIVDFSFAETFALPTGASSFSFLPQGRELLRPHQVLRGGLWFRPPPAL
jgi:hypothetical protein